jgi:hypothetical protein
VIVIVCSDAWYGCMRLANIFLETSAAQVTETTTRCTLLETDPTFAIDPCCNPQYSSTASPLLFVILAHAAALGSIRRHRATFEQNCVARPQTYLARTYAPGKDTVEALCTEVPGCVYLSLSDYARFRKREDDPTLSCASLTQAVRVCHLPIRLYVACLTFCCLTAPVHQRAGLNPEPYVGL